MEAFFCTDLQATPAQILPWVVMRWSVEGTFEEGRAHLGLETQRQWSDHAVARTTPVLLALFSLVTVLALQLSQGGQIPVPVTAWYHKGEPTFADCLALVRRHLLRARYLVNSAPQADFVQFPRETFDLLINGLPLAAWLAKVESQRPHQYPNSTASSNPAFLSKLPLETCLRKLLCLADPSEPYSVYWLGWDLDP